MSYSPFIIALPACEAEKFRHIKDFREIQTMPRAAKKSATSSFRKTNSNISREAIDSLSDLIPPDPGHLEQYYASDSVSCGSDTSDSDEASEHYYSFDEQDTALVLGRPGLSLNRDYLNPPSADTVAGLPRNDVHVCSSKRCGFTTSSMHNMKMHICPRIRLTSSADTSYWASTSG